MTGLVTKIICILTFTKVENILHVTFMFTVLMVIENPRSLYRLNKINFDPVQCLDDPCVPLNTHFPANVFHEMTGITDALKNNGHEQSGQTIHPCGILEKFHPSKLSSLS